MRAMVMEFPNDRTCEELDRQYMLGNSLLIAPIFREDDVVEYYLPKGKWTHLLSGEVVDGGMWQTQQYDFDSLPLFVRENSLIAFGAGETQTDYDYLDGLEVRLYQPIENPAETIIVNNQGQKSLTITMRKHSNTVFINVKGEHKGIHFTVFDGTDTRKGYLVFGNSSMKI